MKKINLIFSIENLELDILSDRKILSLFFFYFNFFQIFYTNFSIFFRLNNCENSYYMIYYWVNVYFMFKTHIKRRFIYGFQTMGKLP